MSQFFVLLLFLIAGIGAYAQAAVEQTSTNPNYILCRNQKTVRTIRVEKEGKNKECVTMYTKAGVDKEVGRAQNINSCTKVMDNIKTNLEKANWKCKEVGSVSTTNTIPDNTSNTSKE